MPVALVTDSTAYLPADLREQVAIVPLHVVVGGKEFSEGVDIMPEDVAKALRTFTPVTTSRPAPGAFLAAYQRAAEAGADAVVSVHISSDLSATIGGAELAAAVGGALPPILWDGVAAAAGPQALRLADGPVLNLNLPAPGAMAEARPDVTPVLERGEIREPEPVVLPEAQTARVG